MSMQKSVLTEIIRSLEKKEKREIQKWLLSPAHNQRQDVIRLFEFLSKHTAASDSDIEKEKAWKYVFPGMPYDDAYLRQVMYFLLKAIEEYLVFHEVKEDATFFQLRLAKLYRKRKLEKPYLQAQRIAAEVLEKQPLRNDYYLLNRFFLEQEQYEHLMSISQNAPVNLQQTADALEKWFLEERLRISKDMLAHHNIFQQISYDHGLLNQALAYVEEKKLLDDPAIGAYYYTYKAQTNPNDVTYFDQLEYIIHNKVHYFDNSEIRTLNLAALNYCVGKINSGNNTFSKRLFDLYRHGIEKGYLLENNTLSMITFGNAVGAALKINEFDWAEKFIKNFQHFIEERQRNSIVNFNLARVYFEKGEYGKAQGLLTQFEYDYFLLNIIAKTMLLKIYFETDEYDAFESLLESMRIYLRRKEALDPTRKTAYKNMISLMKKLVNRNPYSKAQTEKLRELIESTNPLMERPWLLSQINKK